MRRYTPVIKAKATDLAAVAALTNIASTLVKPLVEPPVSVRDGSLVTDVSAAVQETLNALPAIPFYFDSLGFEASFRQDAALEILAESGREFTPVFRFNDFPRDVAAARAVLGTSRYGVAIRVEKEDLARPNDAWAAISEFLANVGMDSKALELILDLKGLGAMRVTQQVALLDNVVEFAAQQTSRFAPAKIVILGGSMPSSVSAIDINGEAAIRRLELDLWAGAVYELGGMHELCFGDYGVISPGFMFSGPNPNANGKIRYTTGLVTKVFRGHCLYRPSRFDQYFDLAHRVVVSGVFMGEGFSEGDHYIARCARREVGTGNLATWVKVDTNHHIEAVSRQISRLGRLLHSADSSSEVSEILSLNA